MDPVARIKFSDSLLSGDSSNASIKVIEEAGNLKLQITLALVAKKITALDNPSPSIKANYRDATLFKELFIEGEGNIKLEKIPIPPDEKTSNLIVTIRGGIGTKIPGTGSDSFMKESKNLKRK